MTATAQRDPQADVDELEELRRRLRSFAREKVPIDFLRFIIFRRIDRASIDSLRVMRDHMRSLVG